MSNFVGSHTLTVHDTIKDISFPVLIFYPTQTLSQPLAFGPYTLTVSPDAPLNQNVHPLVIISHGGGSSPLVYRTIAFYLAQNGYIVALPEHYGNNRNNNTLENTLENLENRPHHISLTLEVIFNAPQFKDRINNHKIAMIGHSMGGYTALAIAGGQPWFGMNQKIKVTPNPFVKALVLMAPGTSWFVPNDALKEVQTPILLLSAEHDSVTPRWQAQLVLDLIPNVNQVTFKMIENAGHFSFLSPFPPAMKRPEFAPSTDPVGFDREKFHQQLNQELLTFLHKNL